ncbi:MAG TPA: DUF4163 domain-containing protein [Rhizomicrobium sp.]|jgi:hypothetical protein
MKPFIAALAWLELITAPVLAADYDKTEKTPLYEIRLQVPAAAMAIAPLRDKILTLYKTDTDQAEHDAKDDKNGNPSFSPYDIETVWRVTFENAAMLSLSAETYADTGAAHPNDAFRTLVWDKAGARAVSIDALFAPGQAKAGMAAIARAAASAWAKTYTQRSGQKPGPNADMAKEGISASADKLASYALTYAKGQTTANGIVLLYGAGQVWPHVLGDFRLSVPAAVFAQYLAPRWKTIFAETR